MNRKTVNINLLIRSLFTVILFFLFFSVLTHRNSTRQDSTNTTTSIEQVSKTGLAVPVRLTWLPVWDHSLISGTGEFPCAGTKNRLLAQKYTREVRTLIKSVSGRFITFKPEIHYFFTSVINSPAAREDTVPIS